MSRRTFAKTPDEILDYGWDWSGLLGSETLSSSTWIIDAGIDDITQSNDDDSSAVWLSGGIIGGLHQITNIVIDTAGRKISRTFWLRIVEVRTA
jgi:hypothetical protein